MRAPGWTAPPWRLGDWSPLTGLQVFGVSAGGSERMVCNIRGDQKLAKINGRLISNAPQLASAAAAAHREMEIVAGSLMHSGTYTREQAFMDLSSAAAALLEALKDIGYISTAPASFNGRTAEFGSADVGSIPSAGFKKRRHP